MTRTIALIATVGAAFLFAAPALGDNWGADQSSDPVHMSPDLADRAVAAEQSRLWTTLDAREQSFRTKQVLTPPPDWFERAAEAAVRTYRDPVGDDRVRMDPATDQAPTTVSSGRELELPQIGVGIAIGLLLSLGGVLALRYTRGRQPAH